MSWISLDDKLPEPNEYVLLFDPAMDAPVVASWQRVGCWYSDQLTNLVLERLKPTHWQPLEKRPEPRINQAIFDAAFGNYKISLETNFYRAWVHNAKHGVGVNLVPWQAYMVIADLAKRYPEQKSLQQRYNVPVVDQALALFVEDWT
jgi:hypothetical protein